MIEGQEGEDLLLSLCGDDSNWLDAVRTLACQKRFIFFRWPRGGQQREGSSCLGKGLRILGEGDWLFMPPSREKDGTRHAYLNPQLSLILPPPVWLLNLVFTPKREVDHLDSVVPEQRQPHSISPSNQNLETPTKKRAAKLSGSPLFTIFGTQPKTLPVIDVVIQAEFSESTLNLLPLLL